MDNGIFVAGRVLKTERRNGSFVNDRSENIAYDFTLVKFLTGDDTVMVKFKNDRPDAPVPPKGSDVVVSVELVKGQLVAVEIVG